MTVKDMMKKRELIFSVTKKDLVIETFKAGGKGGQNQNVRDTGVRVKHPPSGAVGESREERSQLQNKRTAFKRMTQHADFRFWLADMKYRLGGRPSVEERLEQALQPEHLRVEVKEDGKWVPE